MKFRMAMTSLKTLSLLIKEVIEAIQQDTKARKKELSVGLTEINASFM
jgi:hypothetical protein